MVDLILVKCSSHRARTRLFGALGRKPQGYWTPARDHVYGVYAVGADELATARAVKGVSKVRQGEEAWLEYLPPTP